MTIRERLVATQHELDEAEVIVARLRTQRRQQILEAAKVDYSDAQIGRWIGRPRQSVEAIRRRHDNR